LGVRGGVSKDNPLNEISVDELERIFGGALGRWELVNNDYLLPPSTRAAGNQLAQMGPGGLKARSPTGR